VNQVKQCAFWFLKDTSERLMISHAESVRSVGTLDSVRYLIHKHNRKSL
jgi:hypothetical protein